MTPDEVATVLAEHQPYLDPFGSGSQFCGGCPGVPIAEGVDDGEPWPCLTYVLASEVDRLRTEVEWLEQRVRESWDEGYSAGRDIPIEDEDEA